MKALFYADGGAGAGLGHLRRCLALNEALLARGWQSAFLAPNADADAWLKARGIPSVAVGDIPKRLPDTDYSADVFILDSYLVDNEEVALRARGKAKLIAAFDDMKTRHPAADIIINSVASADSWDWPARGRLQHLLGPRYQPLPSAFRNNARRHAGADIGRVLVTLGGTAREEDLGGMLQSVSRSLPKARIDCVVGPFTAGIPGSEGASQVRLHRDLDSLQPLMAACDLAVTGGGQTLFELAATGTPAVAVSLAENQVANVAGMAAAGCVLDAGAIADKALPAKLESCLARVQDTRVRQVMADKGQQLVDGEGAYRIEQAFSESFSTARGLSKGR